jgi:hypothetical protein
MKKMMAVWAAAIAVLVSGGPLAGHHSLAQFDRETPVRVEGTVVLFEVMNPHSRIFLDQTMGDGRVQRWVVDSPGLTLLTRTGVPRDVLRAGDVIEACGFTLKEDAASKRPLAEPVGSTSQSSTPDTPDRFMNGHLIVMPNGDKRFWSDYGLLDKCLGPGETRDSLVR